MALYFALLTSMHDLSRSCAAQCTNDLVLFCFVAAVRAYSLDAGSWTLSCQSSGERVSLRVFGTRRELCSSPLLVKTEKL